MFHHRRLPDSSTLLMGRTPPNETGFRSDRLQIWYNNTEETWADPALHYHRGSDECFIVLRGSLVVQTDEGQFIVGPREFCCFPTGIYHAIVEVHPPIETLMIRAPSVDDKTFR